MSFHDFQLKVQTKTWRRDSYGLFDYETTNYHNQNFVLSHPGKLSRLNDGIVYANFADEVKRTRRSSDAENPEETILYALDTSEGVKINVEAVDESDTNQLWHVTESGENVRGHKLKPLDIIKLGRVMFRIRQMKVNNTKGGKGQMSKQSIIRSIQDHMMVREAFMLESHNGRERSTTRGSMSGNPCKICLFEKSDEEDDPLISPCKCIGSVKYVHLKCMQNWIKSKLNMQQSNNIITILWKDLNCELCKQKLPITLKHHGEEISLIPFDSKMSDSYVMMESFSKEKSSTGIHLVDLSSNHSFKIGRGHDCDLKISDISVSRVHSIISIYKGNLYIKDNGAKFGTLVLNKGPLVFNYQNTKSGLIQCGRTLFKFSVKRPWMSYIPCLGSFLTSNVSSLGTFELEGQIPNKITDETSAKILVEEEEPKRDERLTLG